MLLFLQRSTLPVTRADHQTQSCKRTPDSISYSAKLVILDALLPASKPASRLSQASEHSSVPKLTNWLPPRILQSVLWRFGWTGLPSEWTYDCIKKQDRKAARFFGVWLVGLKSLQDANAQAVDILIAYFNNCQKNVMG